jgi:hypothetical protein
MPNNYTIEGDQNLTFGIEDANILLNGSADAIGYAQSAGTGDKCDIVEFRWMDGQVRGRAKFNKNSDLKLNFFILHGQPIPALEDTLEINAKQATVDTVDISWQNQQGTSCDLTAKWYEGIGGATTTPG